MDGGISLDDLEIPSEDSFNALLQDSPSDSKVLVIEDSTKSNYVGEVSAAGFQVHLLDISRDHAVDYKPSFTCEAILADVSAFQGGQAQSRSLVFRMADWVKIHGFVILVPEVVYKAPETFVGDTFSSAQEDVPCHDQDLRQRWIDLCIATGLTLDQSDLSPTLDQVYLRFRKTERYAIMGPYPLPSSYCGPISLSEAAWKPFAERLIRYEFDLVLNALEGCKKVLDVGSGYGQLPVEISARGAKAYSIEPNPDRNSIQAVRAQGSGVEIARGTAESIPYPNRYFDAVVAMWVMHYVDDLDQSLREIARVTDCTAKGSRIVIVQGAPENEIVVLLNTVCAPLSSTYPRPNHQGYLLYRASEILTECGFGDIEFHRANSYCEFLEEDIGIRCEKAAEIVAGLWCYGQEEFERTRKELLPWVREHFKQNPHAIGDQVAILVAKPSRL